MEKEEEEEEEEEKAEEEEEEEAEKAEEEEEEEAEKEEEEQAYKALHEKLQKEHEEYLARAKRKEEETRLAKKRRYDKKCEETFKSGAGASASATARTPSAKLGYGDIPWPAPRGTVADMLEVMLTGADRTDLPTFRKLLKRQQTLWHPDRFAQRCGSRLQETDRKKILDTVTALSQELNRLAQTLRD